VTVRVLLLGFDSVPVGKQDEMLRKIGLRRQTNETFYPSAGFRAPKEDRAYNRRSFFFESSLPTMYDYHIVVVSKEAVLYVEDLLRELREDFVSLMRAPFQGTLVTPIIGGVEHYEKWVPVTERLKQKDGDSLKLREKHWAFSFMKKYQKHFTWKAHADYSIASFDEEQSKRCIASNLADNPIAFESPLGNGRTIFLPFYNFATEEQETLFLRDLLDCIEAKYKTPKEDLAPSWASKPNYRFSSEEEIERRARMVEQEKTSLVQVRSILWLDGVELVNSVAHTFLKLNIQCEVKEIEGRHDIEIMEPDLHGIVEVKGLSGYANYQDIRQLLDWSVEAGKKDETVKGIFVLNDFKDVEPELRLIKLKEKVKDSTSSFTKEAERIAITNNFCLLTTYQLFLTFKQSTLGTFNKTSFVRKLRDTRGVFSL